MYYLNKILKNFFSSTYQFQILILMEQEMTYRSFSIIPELSNNLISDRFTQMDNLFSRITGEKPLSSTPNYNLVQYEKNNYELSISVPGYCKEELDISVLNRNLVIHGKEKVKLDQNEKSKKINWLHRGIVKNNFSFNFKLAHKINIQSAILENGILQLTFCYDIPEKEKPKKISIHSADKSSCMIEK